MNTFSDAAKAARVALGDHFEGEGYSAPIDPVVIARQLGINVWTVDMEPELSGMIAKTVAENDDVDLIVNSEHAPVRQRFTIAHELGHYFSALNSDPELNLTFLHRRDQRSSCGTHADEVYANKFAAELLMPLHLVKEHVERGENVGQLARSFNVSIQAMNHRLDNLNLRTYGA